jgi:hypothetical protein
LFIVFPNGHKPANGLELQEQDLRYVSDYIIAENTFREFPLFAMPEDANLYNKIASLNNNAYFNFDVVRDETTGEPLLDDEGNEYYSDDKNTYYSQGDSDEYNAIYWTQSDIVDGKIPMIEKTLRYKRN